MVDNCSRVMQKDKVDIIKKLVYFEEGKLAYFKWIRSDLYYLQI